MKIIVNHNQFMSQFHHKLAIYRVEQPLIGRYFQVSLLWYISVTIHGWGQQDTQWYFHHLSDVNLGSSNEKKWLGSEGRVRARQRL